MNVPKTSVTYTSKQRKNYCPLTILHKNKFIHIAHANKYLHSLYAKKTHLYSFLDTFNTIKSVQLIEFDETKELDWNDLGIIAIYIKCVTVSINLDKRNLQRNYIARSNDWEKYKLHYNFIQLFILKLLQKYWN